MFRSPVRAAVVRDKQLRAERPPDAGVEEADLADAGLPSGAPVTGALTPYQVAP